VWWRLKLPGGGFRGLDQTHLNALFLFWFFFFFFLFSLFLFFWARAPDLGFCFFFFPLGQFFKLSGEEGSGAAKGPFLSVARGRARGFRLFRFLMLEGIRFEVCSAPGKDLYEFRVYLFIGPAVRARTARNPVSAAALANTAFPRLPPPETSIHRPQTLRVRVILRLAADHAFSTFHQSRDISAKDPRGPLRKPPVCALG